MPSINVTKGFALGFRFLALRAAAIDQRREALKDSTLAQYDAGPQRRIDQLLAGAARDAPTARRRFRFISDTTCPTPTMLASTHCDHQ